MAATACKPETRGEISAARRTQGGTALEPLIHKIDGAGLVLYASNQSTVVAVEARGHQGGARPIRSCVDIPREKPDAGLPVVATAPDGPLAAVYRDIAAQR